MLRSPKRARPGISWPQRRIRSKSSVRVPNSFRSDSVTGRHTPWQWRDLSLNGAVQGKQEGDLAMKRFVTAALAAATLVAPLALPTPALAQRHDRGDGDWNRDHDGDRDWDNDRDRDGDWRDHRRHDRGRHRGWDRRQYNGYNYRGRWYYGPPPAAYAPYADYGWRSWRRGDRLPAYYRDSYYAV